MKNSIFFAIIQVTVLSWFIGSFFIDELKSIMEKFAASGWDLISVPAQQWLDGKSNVTELISAITKADEQCGTCGCDFDPLYKKALDYFSTAAIGE